MFELIPIYFKMISLYVSKSYMYFSIEFQTPFFVFFCCIFVFCFVFPCPPMPSQEIDDAIDTCELDLNGPCGSGPVSSGGRERDAHFRAQRNPEERNKAGDIVPWENRYEKLWVEVEKREVKSTFKHVAGELKEKFGELLKSRSSAGDVAEDEPAESTPAEEESSGDEDEGEVIVRPMARARSTVLLPIAEQRESGPESTDDSVCEDEMPLSEPPEGNMFREPDLGEGRPRDAIHMASTDDRCGPVTDRKRSAKLGPFQKPHLDLISMDGAVKRDEAERKDASSDEDPEEVAKSAPTPLGRRSGSVPGVSDEEHKDHMERCKREVGILKNVFLDLKEGKAQPEKEVEDGRPSHSPFLIASLFLHFISVLNFISLHLLF